MVAWSVVVGHYSLARGTPRATRLTWRHIGNQAAKCNKINSKYFLYRANSQLQLGATTASTVKERDELSAPILGCTEDLLALELLDPDDALRGMAEDEQKAFLIEAVDVVRLYVVFPNLFLQPWKRKW